MKQNFEIPETPQDKDGIEKKSETRTTKDNILKKALQRLGLAAALFGATASPSEAQKTNETASKESLPKITRTVKDMDVVAGRSYGAIQNLPNVIGGSANASNDVDVMIQHNIKRPESLSEFGKMLVEPISVSISFPYGKDHAVAKIKTWMFGEESKTQIVDINIPYRYAETFDKADPKDVEEMKKQATEDAEKLFDSIMTEIFGLSFFKNETLQNHEENGSPITKVNKMSVEGFASPESTDGVNLDDKRNLSLSELRAENAANTIREIFAGRNIAVDDISFHGSGEEKLAQDELEKLAGEAVRLDLSDEREPLTAQVLDIITKYNNGELNNDSATELLNELVGNKRKVILHMEIDEQEKILVLPLPLLLIALLKLSKHVDFSRLFNKNGSYTAPPKHRFIRSEDPTRPEVETLDGIEIKNFSKETRRHMEGSITKTERLSAEAEKFMMSYSKDNTVFFIVSSNDPNDLETANAYRLAAQKKDIRILKPKNPRGDREDITDGYVRVIKTLGPTPNKTEEEAYVDDFEKIVRLVDFGGLTAKKIEHRMQKRGELDKYQEIIILAFGEGEVLEHALNRYFPTKTSSIRNLEVIKFGSTLYGIPRRPMEDKNEEIEVAFRNKTKKIKDASEEEKSALTFFRKKKK